MQTIPLCPITGLPATRRIQLISARLISGLWRGAFGVPTEQQLAGIDHFGLWESPCGLAFFDPMLAGDAAFYLDLHRRGNFHRVLSAPGLARTEFRRVAELVQPGEKVLDVGCGEAALAPHLPDAIYVGLDPHPHATAAEPDIRCETVARHAGAHPDEYDVVCAFHVIEHVSDPLGFARDLVQCMRRDGRLCIVVPHRTSLTEIPNFVLNAQPNHLSWWNEDAVLARACRLRLVVDVLEQVPFSFDSLIYWMERFAPTLTGERYFRAHWIWHAALAWNWLAGRTCDALFRVPATARPSGLILMACKPS